ncbi:BofC C-terminal domain-containing protein [Paenibacillus sp. NPDC058174]|uniref:BofC C-terminal domain-containing protein n=1 Tax=Paenibacillus sp. NPDC058174 TaxID=3346366 RepID=UPI0036D850B2
MMEFSLWKQVRKRLRRRRRSLWILGSFTIWLCALLVAAGSTSAAAAAAVEPAEAKPASIIEALEEQDGPLAVTLRRVYICGEETSPLGRLASQQIVRLLRLHPEWTAVMDRDGQTVMLQEQVEDLSEECRSHAYFGLDKKGYFSLFEGEPGKEKVLRTFFQLDVQYMESSLPHEKVDELAQGIKVSDIDEYNSVLSTFSDFALQAEEKELTPATY